MGDLDLTEIKKRIEAARSAQQAVIQLANAPNVTRFDACVRASFADVAALVAEVERLRANHARLISSRGTSWEDGYATGCGMSHSLGCDAVAAERDALKEELAHARAALLEEQTVHAKTFDNFEAHLESCTEGRNTLLDDRDQLQREVEGLRAWRDGNHDEHRQLRVEVERLRARVEDEEEMVKGIRESLAWVEREYRQCIVSARCTHDHGHYEKCNGRAEAYRQLADSVAAAAGLAAPDWDRIRREVPSDGIYREVSGG